MAIIEAVTNQVKRNRKANHPNDALVTLQERRAMDRSTITSVIRDNQSLLTPWTEILASILKGKKSSKFSNLKSVDDFIDGF